MNRVAGAVTRPSSHTTGRAGRHPAVHEGRASLRYSSRKLTSPCWRNHALGRAWCGSCGALPRSTMGPVRWRPSVSLGPDPDLVSGVPWPGSVRSVRSAFLLQVSLPPRPPPGCLLCGSCSSGQSFAFSFLPASPQKSTVAVQLGGPGTQGPQGPLTPKSLPVRLSPHGYQRQSRRFAPCLAHKENGSRPTAGTRFALGLVYFVDFPS